MVLICGKYGDPLPTVSDTNTFFFLSLVAPSHCMGYICELIGSRVVDNVSRSTGQVLGCASNPHKLHASVSVRSAKGIVSDVPISRLELVKNSLSPSGF